MPDLTPEGRDRLRELAENATPGPWEARRGSQWDFDGSQVAQSSVRRADRAAITWDDHGGEVFVPADAEFIAAAREAVPALLDALDEAEAVVERVREMHVPQPHSPGQCDPDGCPDLCQECGERMPCTTVRTLGGDA